MMPSSFDKHYGGNRMVWAEDMFGRLKKGDEMQISASVNGRIDDNSKLNKRLCTIHANTSLEMVRVGQSFVVVRCNLEHIQLKAAKEKITAVTVRVPIFNLWWALDPKEKKRIKFRYLPASKREELD